MKLHIASILVLIFVLMISVYGCNDPVETENGVKILGVELSKDYAGTGEQVNVRVTAISEEENKLDYIYEVTGGTISGSGAEVTWSIPDTGGTYSINVTVTDGAGGSDNKTEKISVAMSPPIDVPSHFAPAAWMGDGELGVAHINIDENCREQFHSPPTSTKWTYSKGPTGWAAVAYVYPKPKNEGDINWGQYPGLPIIGAKQLTFWAKGEDGDELIDFKIGCMTDTTPNKDSLCVERKIALTREWKQYQLDITGRDTKSVIWGFVWSTNQSVTFYLDDIRIE